MIYDFLTFILNEKVEHRKKVFYHGVKKHEDVDKIIKNGFDLTFIKPLWSNDYAISVLTTPQDVRKFFGKDVPVLKLEFEGDIAGPDDFNNVYSNSPQDYTRKIVASGIDAVQLGGNGGQFFIYNPKAIKRVTLL